MAGGELGQSNCVRCGTRVLLDRIEGGAVVAFDKEVRIQEKDGPRLFHLDPGSPATPVVRPGHSGQARHKDTCSRR